MLAIEVVVFLGFARFVFGVPFRGPLWQLALICVLTSLVFSALGLLVASRARTMEAVSGLMNLVMLPMWILSGVFFSASRFPGRDPAAGEGAAADRGDRCHARQHAAGNSAGSFDDAFGDFAGVVRAAVCGFAQDLSLALRKHGQ